MQGLIAFIMQGRVQAAAATAVTALLSLIMSPFAIVSMAVLVLATLRNGLQEGLIVVVLAAFVLAGMGALLFQLPVVFALLGATFWLPAWGLASLLGRFGSLTKVIGATVLGGFFIVGLQYFLLESPGVFWREVIQEFMQTRFNLAAGSIAEQSELFDKLAEWMPGSVAASWFISMILALSLGRWASLKLDGPSGAFGAEFRGLRLERLWLAIPMVLLVPTLLDTSNVGVSSQLLLVTMVLFMLQGISVVHAFAHRYSVNRIGLISLYFVLLIGAPYSMAVVAVFGYVDGLLDFRARAGVGNQS